MANQRPHGADGNALSWTHIFNRDEGSRIRAKLSRSGASNLYKEKHEVIGAIGQTPYDSMVKARYDWLFDDLQQFSSISAESIESKEDLKNFVEQTIGESKGFLSMKEKNPRRYNTSINRATESLWRKGMVEGVARTNVVEEVREDRASILSERIKKDSSRRKALSDSRLGNLYLVRREKMVSRRIDKRGRVFFMEVLTGRRTGDPNKLLRALGFTPLSRKKFTRRKK